VLAWTSRVGPIRLGVTLRLFWASHFRLRAAWPHLSAPGRLLPGVVSLQAGQGESFRQRVDSEVQDCREDGPDQRGQQEHPELGERRAAGDHRGTKASSRVHGRAIERNADQVRQRQRYADAHPGHGDACFLLGQAEHHQHEGGGEDDLDQERATCIDVQDRLRPVSVGSEADPGFRVIR
jgi:hypothetical protein